MKNNLLKKYSIIFVIAAYTLSYLFQSFSFFSFNKVYAKENQLKYTNLVAIFVDDSIYNTLQNEIEWYAKNYIQGADASLRYSSISNSKAIVLPVDTNTISAQEITKILENMYFDGISGEPSKLIGTILIGEIPMPVVNQNGFIYPSIYPYVDFEEQKFIWNNDLKYFVYNDNPKGQPEIWHGLINFDNIQEYKNYFEKLKTYAHNPSDFIGKNIWYDDFVANKQFFYQEGLPAYINNFLFAEDIGYKRYSDLMLKVMQGIHNTNITNAFNNTDWDNIGIGGISGDLNEILSVSDDISSPTIFVEKIIKEGYLQSYMSLFGEKQLSRALENVGTSNRWIENITDSDGEKISHTAMDSHYTKIEQKDETLLRINGGLEPLLISINNALESIVDEKIEQEKYRLNEVIPLTYLEYEGYKKGGHCTWKVYDAYENYFFGINAKYINNMKQISTYRGTFGNFDNIAGLTINTIKNGQLKSGEVNSINANKKSIGGSYDIFATQVDANRGYNIKSTVKELSVYQANKIPERKHRSTICQSKRAGICWKKRKRIASTKDEDLCDPNNEEEQGGCETLQEFSMRNRGGASPLNLDADNGYSRISGYNFQDAIMPIFDIKGSKMLATPQLKANSFKGISEYSRLIQRTFVPDQKPKYYTKNKDKKAPDLFGFGYNPTMGEDMKFTNRLPTEDLEEPIRKYVEPKRYNDVDFFTNFNKNETKRENDIIKIIIKTETGDCLGSGKIYTYKTLDSRVKNNMSLEKDLSDSVYKIFEDSESPSVIFKEQLTQKIDLILLDTQNIIRDLQGTGTGDGVMKSLKDIKNKVDYINAKINNIKNQSIESIISMNPTEIQNLSNQWQQAFKNSDVNTITQLSENVQDQLIGLFLTVSDFDFEDPIEFTKNQIEGAKLMGNELFLLNTWTNELINKVDTTKNNIYNITGLIINVKEYYSGIDLLNIESIKTKLQNKYNDIKNLNNGSGCNSNSQYISLCNTISTVKNAITNNGEAFNKKISEIKDTTIDDDDENGLSGMWGNLLNLLGVQDKTIFEKIQDASNEEITDSRNKFYNILNSITKSNRNLTGVIAGINATTLDRPIDSPKYVTFKGIGGDEVIFIYPNLYKAEIFSGNNLLKLKSPEDISKAIKNYLREVVEKYNSDINNQKNKRGQFFNKHPDAFQLLGIGSGDNVLANPKIVGTNERPYQTIPEDYLIVELENKLNNNAFFNGNMGGYEPIEFLAHIIYYQNLGRGQRELGTTIQEDIDNTISDFDVNEKIHNITQSFLVRDNDKGTYITPGYRNNGYEVAFINSDGNDYISAKAEPPYIESIKTASNNYIPQSTPNIEQSELEEELSNECNIPEAEGVLLFDLKTQTSPWANALVCRREKTKKSPFKIQVDWSNAQGPVFDPNMFGDGWGNAIGNIIGIDNIQSQYLNQLGYTNSEETNQTVLDNSTPGDYQKLDKILSYTKIEKNKNSINADNATGIINISSSTKLGNVKFYIKNVGNSVLEIKETESSNRKNVSEGTTGFATGNMIFDPFNKKEISFRIQEPKVGSELLVFYMCLPNTTDINNCVTKNLKLNIVPGQIDEVKIIASSTGAIQGSKIPIKISGKDKFGNNVGQLITERFEISTSTGTLSSQSSIGDSIIFSDFNNSDFVLSVNKNTTDKTIINIKVDGIIGSERKTLDTGQIEVVKGNIKIYSGENEIKNLIINLPGTNDYFYKDSFDIQQTNLATTPKIKIKLQNSTGEAINLKSFVNVTTKNGLLKPGEIEQKSITKKQNNNTFQVTQKRFSQKNNFTIESGELLVYLMPNFKAGQDTISITIPGLEPVLLNITVNPAPANMIEINTEKDTIIQNSSTKANLKIYDNRGNLVKLDTEITLGVAGTINISGVNSASTQKSISSGNFDFEIKSRDKGGNGFIYATINGLELIEQKPGSKTILVQGKMLPEEDLNVMYLNLFGSDRGNQRGFMSDNEKYVQKLISNSKKLITTTTQLINPDNIRQFSVVVSKKLHFTQTEQNDISLQLDKSFIFDVKGLGKINMSGSAINLKWLKIDDQLESNFKSLISGNTISNKNTIIYLSQSIDSLIESNEVKKNSIFVNKDKIFDLNDKKQDTRLSIEFSNRDFGGYQIWEAKLDGKLIGELIFVFNKEDTINLEIQSDNIDYDAREIWINGSSNQTGFGLFKTKSTLSNSHLGYKSIQDSADPTLGIGFTADFKNINEFGAGKSVGEATINFASEFLINIGDPLLKRINTNQNSKIIDPETGSEEDSGFDRGLGEVIYSEPNKTIFKVINIDFNNDDLEDIIIAFTDGTVKLLKNYGGTSPFKQIGDLMTLADGIKEIIVGDVDGNGYKDIIIWNNSNMLRVYKNRYGVFDVDGLPVCINTNVKNGELSETPQIINGIGQIFFEDMDNDGSLDIVTNDNLGYIKIFYGGQTNGKDNYISNNKNICDNDWYQRQVNNTNMVYRFGLRINENINVVDNSLIRWKGMSTDIGESEIDVSQIVDTNISITEDDLTEDKISETLKKSMNFDIETASQMYMNANRYVSSDLGVIPYYEENKIIESIKYVNIRSLESSDPVKITKKYRDINGNIVEKGDKVQVSVTIKALSNFTGTFIDIINGPRIIPTTGQNEMIENFWFEPGTISTGKIENQLKFYRDLKNGRYMIDNLSMKASDEIIIHYRIFYDEDNKLNKISIEDIDGTVYDKFGGTNGEKLVDYSLDEIKDIKILLGDGCNKSMFALFNEKLGNKRTYNMEYIDLAKSINKLTNNNQSSLKNTQDDIIEAFTPETEGELPNLNNIPGVGPLTETQNNNINIRDDVRNNILDNNGLDLSNLINIALGTIDGLAGDSIKHIDSFLKSACDGFDLSDFGIGGDGSCGLPIPFNQAFLAPGDYHLFGCFKKPLLPLTNTVGKGIPIFSVPTIGPLTVLGVPAPPFWPRNFQGAGGIFGGNSSQFRIYVVPTLTAHIGIAMCFGPYSLAKNLPDPLSSVAGNCIVMSFPLPCNSKNNDPNINIKIDDAFTAIGETNVCNTPPNNKLKEGESFSSLELVSGNKNTNNLTLAIPDGSFAGGFIKIEKTPITSEGYRTFDSGIGIEGITLKGGIEEKNKILGAEKKGFMKKLVDDIIDKQIDYIFNNLSNFKLDIKWPDFEGIIKIGNLSEGMTDAEKEIDCKNKGGIRDKNDNKCKISEKQACINKGRQWDESTKTCRKKVSPSQNEGVAGTIENRANKNLINKGEIEALSNYGFANPLEQLEKMLDKIPLINLRTESIIVNVPMLTSEDIGAYTSMSKNRIENQMKTLQKRFELFASILRVCGQDEEINDFEELKTAVQDVSGLLEEQYEQELKEINKSPKNKENNENIENIKKKLEQIKKLTKNYNLDELGNYVIFEGCENGEYFIRLISPKPGDSIIPDNVYISYKEGNNNGGCEDLKVFTEGYKLNCTKTTSKIKVSIIKDNNKDVPNEGLCLKNKSGEIPNQCIDLFVGKKFNKLLNDFFNIQTNLTQLIDSVEQNLDTLDLYKKFPLELYERAHVGERYLGETASLVNNVLGILSMRAQTNATRYSQYIDSIILIKTMLETYQIIVDISANRSEKCGTCTQDNYDQFACKLDVLCPDSLPIIPIPPFKIPSIFMDFSKINLGMDIKLPKFSFITTEIPLPKLPNLPEPPTFNAHMDIEQSISMGFDIFSQLLKEIGIISDIQIPVIPLIPEPPTLPQLPSFIPNIKMELPLLPPAPKIPKIPNELNATIKTIEFVAKILCIIKKKFGLVGENSIKAKIEQMTQRTYEIPRWDNMEQEISKPENKVPERIQEMFPFLKSNMFKEANLKGIDVGIESVVDIQFNFDGIFDFINAIVNNVNNFSTKYTTSILQSGVGLINQYSREIEQRLATCVSNPISEYCLGDYYTEEIDNLKTELEEKTKKMGNLHDSIVSSQDKYNKLLQQQESLKNNKEELESVIQGLQNERDILQNNLETLEGDLAITTIEERIKSLNKKIKETEQLLDNNRKLLNENKIKLYKTTEEIKDFDQEHNKFMVDYENFLELYDKLKAQRDEINTKLMEKVGKAKDKVMNEIEGINQYINENNALEHVKERNDKVKNQLDEKKESEGTKQEQRKSNVQNLYKDLNSINNISYIDYNLDTYEESKKTLTTAINTLISKNDNQAINKKMNEALSILHSNTELTTKEDNIKILEQKYLATVGHVIEKNKVMTDLLKDDYDKFLYAIQNDKKLVNEGNLEVSLSTNLFDMDKNLLENIKGIKNIHEQYIDYYENQINGYLNALNNNSAGTLNMSQEKFEEAKNYITILNEKTKLASNMVKNGAILSQNMNNNNNNTNSSNNNSSVDIASYINIIKTPQGSITLANKGFTKTFQGKYLVSDINGDKEKDLVLRDEHNLYVKYKNGNRIHNYDSQEYYKKYYKYNISTYKKLLKDSEDKEGFVKINDILLKLCDEHREVKNFKYNGGDYDSININRSNSRILGDDVDGYLVKLIHRIDLFNDKIIINNSNKDFFDKKYILVLPKGSIVTGAKIGLEEKIVGIEDSLSGIIWDILYYNEGQEKINLTLEEIPRNWQYGKIYTLKLEGENFYQISNPSSNQVVGGPQIVGYMDGPASNITLNRPSTNESIDGGENFELYVGTRYTLKSDWEDHIGLKKLWISDSYGNIIKQVNNINNTSGSIQLNNLYFTGEGTKQYYFVATNILGNSNSTQITLNIKSPEIRINNINTYGETEETTIPTNIIAEISHDIDEGYVQFLRKRNTNWEIITGSMGGIKVDKYKLSPGQTIITGGYFDFGNDIGLYLSDGNLAAKINPKNGKISIENGYQNRINLKLDFTNKTPMIKVLDEDEQIFAIVFNSKELIKLESSLETRKLEGNSFGDFNGGNALIYDDEVLMYISPKGKIFVEDAIYGDYTFNEQNQSVVYKFRKTKNGNNLGFIEIKIKNLLGE